MTRVTPHAHHDWFIYGIPMKYTVCIQCGFRYPIDDQPRQLHAQATYPCPFCGNAVLEAPATPLRRQVGTSKCGDSQAGASPAGTIPGFKWSQSSDRLVIERTIAWLLSRLAGCIVILIASVVSKHVVLANPNWFKVNPQVVAFMRGPLGFIPQVLVILFWLGVCSFLCFRVFNSRFSYIIDRTTRSLLRGSRVICSNIAQVTIVSYRMGPFRQVHYVMLIGIHDERSFPAGFLSYEGALAWANTITQFLDISRLC
jgi:hypothetical protein